MISFIEFVIEREIDDCAQIIVENQLQLNEGFFANTAKAVAPWAVDAFGIGQKEGGLASKLGKWGAGAAATALTGNPVAGAAASKIGERLGRSGGRRLAIRGLEKMGQKVDDFIGSKTQKVAQFGRSLLGKGYLNDPDFQAARTSVVNLIGSLEKLSGNNQNYNSILQIARNIKQQLVDAAKQKNTEAQTA